MKKGEKRKTELLRIAYGMFLTKGYENTSVDEIIDEAGIAKGTFYYYFKTKEQMLEEVIDMMLEAEEEKARMIIQSDIPVAEKVIGVIASFRPEESEEPIKEALHETQNIIMHEKTNQKLMDRIVPLLTEVAEQGVREGLFGCGELPERVKEIVILSNGLFDGTHHTGVEADVFIDTIERILYAKPGSMGFVRQLLGE
ncbi:MAG: TetR/AcrR family transcriptional regulator [Lachnospiraceae bacterium]|nr:TetR/AcrR family transcriptional regulator [Lachnospiraceae bacterium]